MKNKWIYFVSGFLCAGVFSVVIAGTIEVPVGIDPLYNPDGTPVSQNTAIPTDPTNPIVAVISIHKNGQTSLTTANGSPATRCQLRPEKSDIPRCRGVENGNIESILSIPVLQTKGSICFTSYNSLGLAEQVCWP